MTTTPEPSQQAETLELRAALDQIARLTGDLLLELDTGGQLRGVQGDSEALLGRRPEELIGASLSALIDPDDRDEVLQGLLLSASSVTRLDQQLEARLLHADGSSRWFLLHLLPPLAPGQRGQPPLSLVLARDVHRHRRDAEVRERLEEARRALFHYSDDVIWVMGADLRQRYLSATVERQLGYTVEEYSSMSLAQRLPPGAYEVAQAAFTRAFLEAKELAARQQPHSFRFEIQHRHKDGRLIWGEINATFLYDAQWQITGISGVTRNVQQRKEVELQLQRSTERYHHLFEQMLSQFVVVQVVAATGSEPPRIVVQEVNQACERGIGRSRQQLVGQEAAEVFPSKDPAWSRDVLQVARTGEPARAELHDTALGRSFEYVMYRVEPGQVAIIVEDVTEARKRGEELAHLQRLDGIGLLAGGIAHDFNNLLTAILGSVSLARVVQSQGGQVSDLLENAEQACRRARGLTQQLLTFARGGEPVKRLASLPELLREAAGFVLSGSSVSASYAFSPDVRPVRVDQGQIGQVVQNLVLNAIQAMPSGGSLELGADLVELRPDQIGALPAGSYVRLTVRDHGVGIPPEHLPRVFDPYFTTRAGGTGLGLAVAYSIVRKHGGTILVESSPGAGSTFTVFLPASADSSAALLTATAGPARPSNRPPAGAAARVLVMDDEPAVRQVLAQMLEALGHVGTFVPGGAEAVQAYQRALQEGVRYDLVLLDLTVPGGLGGRAALQQLLALDRQVKAVVMSGYSNDPVMAHYRNHGFCGVLPKPVELAELGSLLARLTSG